MSKSFYSLTGVTIGVLLLLFVSCSKDEGTVLPPDIQYAFGTPPVTPEVSAEKCIQQGDSLFAMSENLATMVSAERWFNVNAPLTCRFKDGKLEVRNFMAHEFKDVTVLLTVPYLKDTIKLITFKQVPPFYEVRTESPLTEGEKIYATTSGKPVRTNNLYLLSEGQYQIHVSCNDSILDMVRSNKMKTEIRMGTYDGGSWVKLTPTQARLFCAATVNFTLMLSSDLFADSLINYKGCKYDPDISKTKTDENGVVKYYDLCGYPTTAQGIIRNDAGQATDRQKLLNDLRSKALLVCGTVSGVAGLGGGNTYGIGTGYCYSCFYSNRVTLNSNYVISVMVHELGHCTGYGHGSSVAANGYGERYASVSEYIAPTVYRILMQNQKLPYLINPFKQYNDYAPEAQSIDETLAL